MPCREEGLPAMNNLKYIHQNPELDRFIHEPARLQILSYLTTSGSEVVFTELGGKLGLSAGNLSVQLKRLEKVGYLSINKTFKDNRPLTSIILTHAGKKALKSYIRELEKVIGSLKNAMID